MNNKVAEILSSHSDSYKHFDIEPIQSLWGGYGELNRIILDNNSVILKHIKFPDAKGFAHQRKVKSYQVERYWYENFNHEINGAYSPKIIESGIVDEDQYLVIEDLMQKGFKTIDKVDWEQTKLCLKWLAKFHKHYLGKNPQGLWEIGTYWHLATRPDELIALNDQELKEKAKLIDERLNKAKFKTIVHGDTKLSNFLFNQTETAAVDFQYVGSGVGIKDVAYFLSSIYTSDELYANESKCLDYYFSELNNIEVESEWRELYPYAWADFYRFLQGWKPGHWKIHPYSQQLTQKVLSCF